MTTKKILLIVGGIVAVLGLVVALFVGGIVWVAISAIGKSEAAQTAKTFLQQNEKLKSDIGEVREFGFWVTGNINSNNADGEATLNLKAIGAKKSVPASVNLTYRNGREWIVVGATYRNDAGQTIDLLEAGADAEHDAPQQDFDEESFSAGVSQSGGTTLIVFLSKSSLDSLALEKTLNEISEKYSERVSLIRYSLDEQPDLYRRFDIGKIPVVLIYQDGQEHERRAGALSKQQLSRLLDKYLETE